MELPVYKKRLLSKREKRNIVLLRFGAVGDTANIHLTIPQISRKMNINYYTIDGFLRRYLERGEVAISSL